MLADSRLRLSLKPNMSKPRDLAISKFSGEPTTIQVDILVISSLLGERRNQYSGLAVFGHGLNAPNDQVPDSSPCPESGEGADRRGKALASWRVGRGSRPCTPAAL